MEPMRRCYAVIARLGRHSWTMRHAIRSSTSPASGVLNKDNPLFSFVALAPSPESDGRLEVHDVFGMHLPARLVVLSACHTGLGSGRAFDVPPGDDWVGLVQAFHTGGSRQSRGDALGGERSGDRAVDAAILRRAPRGRQGSGCARDCAAKCARQPRSRSTRLLGSLHDRRDSLMRSEQVPISRRLSSRETGAFRAAVYCVGVLILASCSKDAAAPVAGQRAHSPALASEPFVVSNDTASGSLATVSFVSMRPGTIPSGTIVTIHGGRGITAVTLPMTDGGFDPVAMPAQAGDTLTVSAANLSADTTVGTVFVPHTSVPKIVRVSPANRKTNVSLNDVILIVFDEPMIGSTLIQAIQVTTGGVAVPGTVVPGARDTLSALFKPANPLAFKRPRDVSDSGIDCGAGSERRFVARSDPVDLHHEWCRRIARDRSPAGGLGHSSGASDGRQAWLSQSYRQDDSADRSPPWELRDLGPTRDAHWR